jgi:ribosomal protein S7
MLTKEEYIERENLYLKTYSFYEMKIETEVLNRLKIFEINNNILKNEYFLNKNKRINNFIEINKNSEVVNKLIKFCMRKGKRKLAEKKVRDCFMLIRKYYWISPLVLLKVAILKSEPLLKLYRYMIGNKERIIPRLISTERRKNEILKIIVQTAIKNKKNYEYFYISLANSIIEFTKGANFMIKKNEEENELAELNKYILYKKKKRRRKIKLIRKIKDWNE